MIIRGIERRNIFRRDEDRDDLIKRLALLFLECRISCYAWAFMSNHAHFLFRTGGIPLSTLMRRLLTGYVVGFNRRHNRCGHLFQNRYKSFVCQQDIYLKELARYIHLKGTGIYGNPPGRKTEQNSSRGCVCHSERRENGQNTGF
ncbi:MAG: transposase [Desulfobacterales bacterium]